MTAVSEQSALETLAQAARAYRDGDSVAAFGLAKLAHAAGEGEGLDASKQALISGWYGYLLAIEGGELQEGLAICREAAKKVFWEPYIYENLARLEAEVGSRQRAIAALNKGLRLFPDNVHLLELQEEIGVREKTPVPFLKRNHPINNALGRMMRRKDSDDDAGDGDDQA